MVQSKRLLIFSAVLSILCVVYVFSAPVQTTLPHHSWRHSNGEFLGNILLWCFLILYGRTALKIGLRQGSLFERLLPDGNWNGVMPWVKVLLSWLNKTHPYAGVATVLIVIGHALFEGSQQVNLLLAVVIILSLWQFGFGLFLLSHYQAIFGKQLQRYSYMAHSQMYTGVALGICAVFGHLLFKE